MAKDVRLYARFDIAMDEHPKVMLLSDAAFRALIESTMYARRQLTDGFLAAGIVARKWGNDIAAELTSNHPDRPSWTPVEGGFLIRDYAEHQTTNADIQAKRAAGSKGGRAKADKASSTTPSTDVAPATEMPEQTPGTTGSTSIAKTEIEKETKTTSSNELEARKRATQISQSFGITPEMRAWAAKEVPQVDIDAKLPEFIDYWKGTGRAMKDWVATWRNGMRKQQGFALRDRPPAQPVALRDQYPGRDFA